MSKKKSIKQSVVVQKVEEPNVNTIPSKVESTGVLGKILSGYIPYVIILLFGLALYSNTFKFQFALDDDIVICKNEYVLRGIQGIPDIFSKDLFDSFYKQMNTTAQLSGGRYRPLSVASFALEQEFIGTRQDANFEPNAWDFNKNGKQDIEEDINGDGIYNDKDVRAKGFGLRHFDNVLFYGLAVCMLFLFLSSVVFKQNKLLAFAVSLLFLAHPIHTEVVSNVKSRDEIFSFFFMILTLYMAHQYEAKEKIKYLIFTAFSFFAAILSKEYGATLLILIPLSLYLFSEKKYELSKSAKLLVASSAMFMLYLAIRYSCGLLVGSSNLQEKELMNNPYLLASPSQKIATELFIFLKYFLIQLFPHPLSSDYGYNSIPYKSFSDLSVWISILFMIVIVIGGLVALKKKHWSAFALGFYMLTILLVTNFIFNVGATMGERLVFHSSLGFCMALGFGIVWISEKAKASQLAFVILIPILLAYSAKTYSRNKAWQNDFTLALMDVVTMPESTALNGNACSRNLDLSEWPVNKPLEKEYIRKAIDYGKKAIQLHSGFVNGYLNLGLGYAKIEQFDSAKAVWDIAFRMYPHHPNKPVYYNLLAGVYYNKGYAFGGQQKWAEGLVMLQKAIDINPKIARYWYDLGGFAYNTKDFVKAKAAWTKAYELDPKDTNIIKVQGILK